MNRVNKRNKVSRNILGESKPIEVHGMFNEKSLNSQDTLYRWIKRFPTVASPLAISIEDRLIVLAPLHHSQGDSQVIILKVCQVIFSSFSTRMNSTSALIFTEFLFSFPAGINFESSSTAYLLFMLSSTKFSILFAASSCFFFSSATSYSSVSTVDCDIKMEYQICALIWVGVCSFLFVL